MKLTKEQKNLIQRHYDEGITQAEKVALAVEQAIFAVLEV